MPSDAQTSGAAERPGTSVEPVRLGDRWEVQPGSPLPNLGAPAGNAFAVHGLRDKRTEAFALVTNGAILPRLDILATISNTDGSVLMRLIDWGVIDWATDRARRFTMVFERPGGRRLMNTLSDVVEPMPEETLTRLVIQPAVSMLREISSRGFSHGAIRPTNIFYRDLTAGGIMIGECASSPPGYAQPVLLETIERGMATPSGRGHGTVGDDLYSLGVTLLILLLGRNPVAGMEDEQLIQTKIERGSYPALVGQTRLPLGMTEVIRGLLVDDPKQRWTLNDLDLWLSGRRLSPKQPQVPRRAARPLEFQGQEYWHCRTLARAMARYPAAAAPVIEGGELDKWLRRSMSDDARAEAVAHAVQTASGAGKGGTVADRLVARVCIALDPTAPIRYKNRAAMPDGVGTMLAEAFLKGESPQTVAEIVSNQLPMFWANVQTDFRPEFVPLVQTFDLMRSYLDRSAIGQGLERVVYEMNPHMPCLSPMISHLYALALPDMLRALDWVASGGQRSRDPIDRHVAAFINARHRKADDLLFGQLSANNDPLRRAIAMLTILADVQVRTATEPLPHLAAWIASLLDPAVKRFHSRPTQEDVRKQVENAAHGGRLTELLKVVDDPEALKRDRVEFEQAQIAYREADAEIEKLRRSIADRDAIAEGTGRQVAAIVSSVISTLLVAGIIFFFALG